MFYCCLVLTCEFLTVVTVKIALLENVIHIVQFVRQVVDKNLKFGGSKFLHIVSIDLLE